MESITTMQIIKNSIGILKVSANAKKYSSFVEKCDNNSYKLIVREDVRELVGLPKDYKISFRFEEIVPTAAHKQIKNFCMFMGVIPNNIQKDGCVISINPKVMDILSTQQVNKCLLHELVHVRQFLTAFTPFFNGEDTTYSVEYAQNAVRNGLGGTDYYAMPWEIEAIGIENHELVKTMGEINHHVMMNVKLFL